MMSPLQMIDISFKKQLKNQQKCHFSAQISVQTVFNCANSALHSVQTLYSETWAPRHQANRSPIENNTGVYFQNSSESQ